MKEQDRIWILMARKLSGEATEDELKELQIWQQQNPDVTYSLQLLSRFHATLCIHFFLPFRLYLL